MHHAHDYQFAAAAALTTALAEDIARAMRTAIAARGQASLVVSGGRTPVALFNRLSTQDLNWRHVTITLADERWVELDATSSNERLVRRELLRDKAAHARFVGLKSTADSVASGATNAWRGLAQIPRPFDWILLGMGDDGHTASLFPASASIAAALDPSLPPACIATQAPLPPYERLSLNLAALLDARRIVVHIQGATKWMVYQKARAPGATVALPIRAVLRQALVPVDVYWSPDNE